MNARTDGPLILLVLLALGCGRTALDDQFPREGVDASPDGAGGSSAGAGGVAGAGGPSHPGCIAELVVGGYHTCARRTDGTLWCWGRNDSGQLGDGTTQSPRTSAVQVTALGSDVAQVSAGEAHTCARKTDGTLWCWGKNDDGQLGDGTTWPWQPLPVQVIGLGGAVAVVEASNWSTCARSTDGAIWCWGLNTAGELGDGTTESPRTTPVRVIGLRTDVAQLSAGGSQSCARMSDGTLWCWGGNTGDGTLLSHSSPVQVTDLGNDVAQVAAAHTHTCAVTRRGTLWCWGSDGYGEIGDGKHTVPLDGPWLQVLSPVQVTKLGNEVEEVAAGNGFTCARKTDGSLWCWGGNHFGQLGDGTTTGQACELEYPCKPTPVRVELSGRVAEVVGGGIFHTCARKPDGTFWCWGANDDGQLGDGTTTGQLCDFLACHPSPVALTALSCP